MNLRLLQALSLDDGFRFASVAGSKTERLVYKGVSALYRDYLFSSLVPDICSRGSTVDLQMGSDRGPRMVRG